MYIIFTKTNVKYEIVIKSKYILVIKYLCVYNV